MTDTATTEVRAEPAAGSFARPFVWWAWVGAALLGIFLPLWNPYWVRGGDSEVYLGLARSLVLGEGLRFNGQPVGLVPPGWPWLLAGAMKLSPSFAFLKLLPLICLALGLMLLGRVLVRVVSPTVAAIAVLVTALLVPVFQLTYWFHAEGVFCLVTAAALLLAWRIEDGPRWRVPVLMLLCVAAVLTRWAAIIWWPVLAGVLLHGELRPRWNSRWIAAFLTGAITLLTFIALRWALRVDPSEIDPRFDASLSGGYAIVNDPNSRDTLWSRIADGGLWFSGLLWTPLWHEQGLRPTLRVVGAGLIAIFIVTVWQGIRRREWIWLGLAAYCTALALNWPQPVARYLVPVAPLILVAILTGIDNTKAWLQNKGMKRAGLPFGAIFLGITVAINLRPYLIDVTVMRSPDFYGRFQGGTDWHLIRASEYLRQSGLGDGDLVVSRRIATPLTEDFTNRWVRAAHFLTNRAVRSIPDKLTRDPESPTFEWVSEQGARYYLYQPRVYLDGHRLYFTFKGRQVSREEMEWRLYRVLDGHGERVALDAPAQPPTRVPGL